MRKKNLCLLIILGALLVVGWLSGNKGLIKEEKEEVKGEQIEKERSGQVDLVLDFGEGRRDLYSLNIDDSPTVFEILSRVTEENNLDLVTKDFDFGILVEEIDGVKNSQDHFWFYFVDGKMGEVSADKYELKEGNMVEWRYEKIKN